jgi:2'-5' RNA ligase
MAYAVVFYFNKNSENPIYDIWKEFEEVGLSPNKHKEGIRPHMTLAIFDSMGCKECENELKRFVDESNMISIQANHLGVFPNQTSVIFIAPAPNIELLFFQKRIHQILEDKAEGPWEMYLPGKWIPHCTLAQQIEKKDLSTALNTCIQIRLPLELEISQIGVVEFEPIKPLFEIDFSQK